MINFEILNFEFKIPKIKFVWLNFANGFQPPGKTISEYLHDENYYTKADVVNELVIPQQGLDEFLIHNELEDDLTERHKNFLDEMKLKNTNGQNFFLYLQYSNIHTGIMNDVLKVYVVDCEFRTTPWNAKNALTLRLWSENTRVTSHKCELGPKP